MSDSCSPQLELGTEDDRAGYRLHHLEVFNWGTFDKRVWRLTPEGDRAAHRRHRHRQVHPGRRADHAAAAAHRIAYNKAAGADARERTLRSYVEGHYKSERIEATGGSRPVGLRDHRHYSVILGVFANDGFDETVTLAQVFHQRDRSGQPDRFFVTSPKQLSIETDFTDFGADLHDLRRRLRAGGARDPQRLPRIRPAAPPPARHPLRAGDGAVPSDRLDEVGRQPQRLRPRPHARAGRRHREGATSIVTHFDDLTKAHDAVKRAREQLEALEPLVATDDAVRRGAGAARRAGAPARRGAPVHRRIADPACSPRRSSPDTGHTRQPVSGGSEAQAAHDSLVRRARGADRGAGRGRRRPGGELEQQAAAARAQAAERRQRRTDFDAARPTPAWPASLTLPAFATVAAAVATARAEARARAQARWTQRRRGI